MKKRFVMAAVAAFMVSLAMGAIAQEKAAPEASGYTEEAGTITATVQAVDLEKRIVTVKTPKGEVVEIRVDEMVKNLSSVKVGDRVVLSYFKSIAYQVTKPGEAGEIAAKAEVKRVGAQTRLVTKTATIQDIDRNTNNVVLKGPEGNLVGVNVKDPGKLKNVQVGDQVVITYTEALAISLEKATTQ
jgi:hypothetical protein